MADVQTLIYGYGGVRVLDDALQLRPTLPPNATHFALKGIEYMGATLALGLASGGSDMSVEVTGGEVGLTLTDSKGKASKVSKGGAAWTGPAQRVTLAAV